MKQMSRLLFATVLICCSWLRVYAADTPVVGMVLDLQGTGSVVENGTVSKLQLLASLKPQMQLRLEAGAKASVSLYATRAIYQLAGPLTATVSSEKVTVVQGAPAVVKSITEKLVVAAEAANVTPGAYRMRGFSPITLLTPENGTLMLHTRPTFSWEALDDAKFKVEIVDQDARVVASGESDKRSWQLPPKTELLAGKHYRWRVSYVSPADGKLHSAESTLDMASVEQVNNLMALKPSDTAAIEEWVMYAATLQNRGAKDEARQVWQNILKKRPDLLQKVQELGA